MNVSDTKLRTDDILNFWLGDDFPSAAAVKRGGQRWFVKDAAVDTQIREKYGSDVEAALRGDFDNAIENHRDWLALLILLDQFPRNLFRDSPRAFSGDARALTLALAGIERGDDQRVHPLARLFCYLPLEHSEDLAMQERSIVLFRALQERTSTETTAPFDDWLDYAIRHHDVIAKFGRFPHRNAVLGRESTAAERDYLAEPGSGF
ncbi:MAG: DUF924 family protein [Dokdonella sp.]